MAGGPPDIFLIDTTYGDALKVKAQYVVFSRSKKDGILTEINWSAIVIFQGLFQRDKGLAANGEKQHEVIWPNPGTWGQIGRLVRQAAPGIGS
jgi:hypothetical protein